MKKLVSVLLLGLVGVNALPPKPAQGQGLAARAAIAACTAQPEACAVVFAAGGAWVLWQNSPKLWCTAGLCTRQPREFQNSSGGSFYNPASEEFTLSNNRDGCRDKEKRVKKAHPDWDVWLSDMKRNRSPGTFNQILCIWQGRDRKLLKRYYNS